jgi:magnesium transporter
MGPSELGRCERFENNKGSLGVVSNPRRTRADKVGLSPGTLVQFGEGETKPTHISLVVYDESGCEESELSRIEEAFPLKAEPAVTWIDIDGLSSIPTIEALGESFGFHPLVLEDVVTTGQRPKMEEHEGYLYLVLRMVRFQSPAGEIDDEQLSLFLGPRWVVSIQEREGDVFDPVRERIRGGKGRIRKMGAGYLAYALVDAVVDHYFVVLEQLGDRVDTLAERLVAEPGPEALRELQTLRHELLFLRKWVWPLRDVISRLERCESAFFNEATRVYLRDVYDHAIQVLDTVETYRDMVSGMLEIYLSSLSNRLNEIMKVLTIITTIFIPLSFVAGLYGMNFRYMPEIEWRYGYFAILGLMVVVAGWMILYFKRKRWL